MIVTSSAASRPGMAAFVKISAGRALEFSTNPLTSVMALGSATFMPSMTALITVQWPAVLSPGAQHVAWVARVHMHFCDMSPTHVLVFLGLADSTSL